jgi:sulfate permease, SulP family
MTQKMGYSSEGSPFKPAARQPALHRLVPVSEQLPGYQGGIFRRDLLAGLTVAALALPAAMAYAELAGLSPVAGLYALLLPTVAYTLLGSSRQLIVGPEGSIAALAATALVPLAADDPERYASLAALLALLVGACFLVARVIRLGWVADYFSRAVLIGYLHGVAVVLVIGQLAKLLGLDIDAQQPLAQLAEVVREVSELHGTTLAVGLLCLGSLLGLRWRAPKLPGALLVVVAAIAASAVLGLAASGVATVGEIPSGLPSLALPTAPWATCSPWSRRPWGSSSSASRTSSSPPGPSPATTASTSGPTPNWRHGRGQPGRRDHPGLPHRGQWLPHHRQPPDGRPHTALNAQEGLRGIDIAHVS